MVQVSEREFNFLDYLKRCAPSGRGWCRGADRGARRPRCVFLTPTSSRSLSRRSFANATVLRAYLLLLRSYKQNGAHTNHCVVKMLHRLAHDLKMEALLFQLSLFYLFNRLLSDPAAGAYQVRQQGRTGSGGLGRARGKRPCGASGLSREQTLRTEAGRLGEPRGEGQKRPSEEGQLGTGVQTIPRGPCSCLCRPQAWQQPPSPAGAGDLCQVYPGQVLCFGRCQPESLRGAAVLEEHRCGSRDDRGLRLPGRRVSLRTGEGLVVGGGGRPGAPCQSCGTWRISRCPLSFPSVGEKTSPEGEVCYLISPKRETGIEPKRPVCPRFLLLHQRSGGAVRVRGPQRLCMCLIPRSAGKP